MRQQRADTAPSASTPHGSSCKAVKHWLDARRLENFPAPAVRFDFNQRHRGRPQSVDLHRLLKAIAVTVPWLRPYLPL